MAANDPLSLLLGKKKTEQQHQAKAATPSKPAPANEFLDVSDTLGRPGNQRGNLEVDLALGGRQPLSSSGPLASLGGHAVGSTTPAGAAPAVRPQTSPPQASLAASLSALAPSSLFAGPGGSHSSIPVRQAAPQQPASPPSTSPVGGRAAGGPTFEDVLPGEKVHVVVKRCFLVVANPLCEVEGRVLVTNFRLKFQTPKGSLREELRWMQDVKLFDVPLGLVEETKEERSMTVAQVPEIKLKVLTKDLRNLVFLMSTDEDVRNVQEAVASFGTPGNSTLLFAFKHAEQGQARPYEEVDGWQLYDPMQEYARLGIETEFIANPASPWRVSSVNIEYGLCPTYPSLLALPRRLSEHELRSVAGFRKRGRLPAMSWCGGPEMSFASIWRCSQTTEGLMGTKNSDDQKLVESIRRGSNSDRDLLVIDLRPWKSAWANKAGGGGFEGYPRCRLVFGGIDNIHCVRDAWRAMGAAASNVVDGPTGEAGSWIKDVANSNWYDYIGAILGSTMKVLKEVLEYRCSVMVHCSDGWDRTAQATSLSMLCLDSHYRTQAGLLKLVQKEWCSFGHRFRTRMALGEVPSPEYSPVFIQWLECVYQLLLQFPSAFEYTPAVLLRLAHEVTTNRYGTFLCDSEKERMEKVMPFTLSLWSVLLAPAEAATWRNPNYKPDRDPLTPSINQANYVIWEAYWFRYHPRSQRCKVAAAAAPAPFLTSSTPQVPTQAAAAPPAALPAPAPAPLAEPEAPRVIAAQADVEGNSKEDPPGSAPKKKPMPKQVFKDDDDDEDVFAKPRAREDA